MQFFLFITPNFIFFPSKISWIDCIILKKQIKSYSFIFLTFLKLSFHFSSPICLIGNASSSKILIIFLTIFTLSNIIYGYITSYSSIKNAFNTCTSVFPFLTPLISCRRKLERSLFHFFWKRAIIFFLCGIFFCNTWRSSIMRLMIKKIW